MTFIDKDDAWWRRHSPGVFETLPAFEPDDDLVVALQPAIAQLGTIICQFGCEGALGVCLLHKHFDLAADERLVRFIDGKDRGHARPVQERHTADCLPWVWAPAPDPSDLRWFCVEWVAVDHTPPGAGLMLSHLAPVFEAAAALIAEGENRNRLGLAALYAYAGLDIGVSEEVAETTDDARRLLSLRVAPVAARTSGRAVQTLWRFAPALPQSQ